MSHTKNVFNDKLNETPDDTDWNFNELPPPPVEIDLETGLKKWVINDINVYAHTYEGALKVYEQIVDYGHSHTC
jgi:hypothetical protein